ncbi:hypothetical protein BDR07DRAFT_1406590 [Suillus spraguei]|nr:hypothetical protein BDR07DRAFT_1406590 [Suillus spraguei]
MTVMYLAVCFITYATYNWINFVVMVMLWVIIITRLHAMYQGSRKILIFLVVTSLAVNILIGVVGIMSMMYISGEELILSGTYQCSINYAGDVLPLVSLTWITGTVWEVLALCLAIWIAVKHFRELRQHPAGGIIGDCFTVLVKTHVVYFASGDSQIYNGVLSILQVVQMFVLGPRLILSIREYHAKLVADSDAASGMTSIAFQERVHISTGSSV